MGKYLYNGVPLPDIRSVYTPELQAKYPKVFCRVTDTEPILFMFADPSVKFSNFVYWVGTFPESPGDYAYSKCVDGQWGAVTEFSDKAYNTWVDDDTMWSNFDIVYEGEILLSASDPVPVSPVQINPALLVQSFFVGQAIRRGRK